MSRTLKSDWLAEALELHERPLIRYAKWLVGDLESARDVVQETFLRLCREHPAKLEGHLAPWLFTVCRNLALDARKKAARMASIDNHQFPVACDLDERHDARQALARIHQKIQVDFNPARVEAYRLIGYENRLLRPEDFNNDLKDAGEMGAGHTVTALFEIVPRGGSVPGPSIDPSVFQPAPRDTPPPTSNSSDMLVLRVRYKLPDASESTRMDVPLPDRRRAFSDASPDFRFAASVAGFGMILKSSQYRGEATLPWVLDTATASRGQDRGGYRGEFISLVQRALALQTALQTAPRPVDFRP